MTAHSGVRVVSKGLEGSKYLSRFLRCLQHFLEWRDPDSNRGHHDFQSCALPPELSRRVRRLAFWSKPDDSRVRNAGYQGNVLRSCAGYFLAKRSSSKADSSCSLGRAPTTALGCSPGSKRAMVGMLEMPKPPASSDSASTSTLATFREPSYSLAISSITGATWRHGAHQEAQKSTSTGTSELRTSSSNVLAVTATGCAILQSPVRAGSLSEYTPRVKVAGFEDDSCETCHRG